MGRIWEVPWTRLMNDKADADSLVRNWDARFQRSQKKD